MLFCFIAHLFLLIAFTFFLSLTCLFFIFFFLSFCAFFLHLLCFLFFPSFFHYSISLIFSCFFLSSSHPFISYSSFVFFCYFSFLLAFMLFFLSFSFLISYTFFPLFVFNFFHIILNILFFQLAFYFFFFSFSFLSSRLLFLSLVFFPCILSSLSFLFPPFCPSFLLSHLMSFPLWFDPIRCYVKCTPRMSVCACIVSFSRSSFVKWLGEILPAAYLYCFVIFLIFRRSLILRISRSFCSVRTANRRGRCSRIGVSVSPCLLTHPSVSLLDTGTAAGIPFSALFRINLRK